MRGPPAAHTSRRSGRHTNASAATKLSAAAVTYTPACHPYDATAGSSHGHGSALGRGVGDARGGRLRSGLGGGLGGGPARPPAEIYATQLAQMADMGFTNAEQNVRALQMSGGNVNIAIDRILDGRA